MSDPAIGYGRSTSTPAVGFAQMPVNPGGLDYATVL